ASCKKRFCPNFSKNRVSKIYNRIANMRKLISGIFMSLFMLMLNSQISVCKKKVGFGTQEENRYPTRENTWIFLMAGQSNMAGRGIIEPQDTVTNKRILTINSENKWVVAKEPLHFYEPNVAGLDCGMSFAGELIKHIPDSVTIAMIPCAVGGSSVFQWLNNEEYRGVKLFSNFREKVQLSKKKGIIKGILWHQGERNANETDLPEYKDALLKLFAKFRASIGNDKLPIILGELGKFAQPKKKAKYFEYINQIIRIVAEEGDHLHFVSSGGLEHNGDHLHFNSASQRELGRRYAKKYIEIYQFTESLPFDFE
ncbi:MAG: sialate O-acetylesterase, partial [Mariniphaga sp.]